MSLQKQVIELLPVGGVDEGKAKFIPVPFHRLVNVTSTKAGQIEKRSGLVALPTATIDGATLPSSTAAFVAGRELIALGTVSEADSDDPGAYLHSYSGAREEWAPRGPVPQMSVDRREGVRSGGGVGGAPVFVARVGSIECLVYLRAGSDDSYYRVVDRSTDTVLIYDTLLGTTGRVALFPFGGKFTLVWYAAGQFHQTVIDPADLSVTTTTPVTVAGVASTAWTARPTVTGKYAIGYTTAAGLSVRRIDAATSSIDASYLLPARVGTRVALGHRVGYAYLLVAFDDGTDIRATHLIESTMVLALADWQVTPLSIFNGGVLTNLDAEFDDSNRSFVTACGLNLSSYPMLVLRAFSTLGASLMTLRRGYWLLQQHKMFRLDGALYLSVSDSRESADQAGKRFGIALCNLSRHFAGLGDDRPLALEGNIAPFEAIGATRDGLLGGGPFVTVEGTSAWLGVPLAGATTDPDYQVWADTFELRAGRRLDGLWSAAYAANLLHLTGALAVQYDGADAVEVGFLQAPHPEGAATLNYGASGLEGAGGAGHVYQYVAIYEWRDARGQLHRSRVSDALTVTVGTSGLFTRAEVVVQFRHTPLTRRASDTTTAQLVKILVYRTLADTSGPFYQCAFVDGFNEPIGSVLTYTDSEDDAALLAAGRGQLYTSGGRLEAQAPPASRHVQLSGGRVWLTSAEGREVWPSASIVAGEAPSFNVERRITLDDAPDAIVATARCGNTIAIFSESRIFAIDASAGPGPAGGVWPQPEMVQSSVGCSSARSVVSFRDGVMFLSPEGLRLLTPGFDLVAVGESVRETLAAYPNVLDAQLDGPRQRIYYLLSASTTVGVASVVLVYDYRQRGPDGFGLWSLWTFGQALERIGLWQDSLVAAHSSSVLLEGHGSSGGYDDFGAGPVWVTAQIETPWIRLGALGGYQRVWRTVIELEAQSLAAFNVSFFNDGDTTSAAQTEAFTEAQLDGERRQRWVVGVAQQKCQSFKVRWSDSAPADVSASNPTGFLYYGLTLEIGAKRGVEKAEKGRTR